MDKDKALAAALSQIERNFGKGTVMKFGEGPIAQIEAILTNWKRNENKVRTYTARCSAAPAHGIRENL